MRAGNFGCLVAGGIAEGAGNGVIGAVGVIGVVEAGTGVNGACFGGERPSMRLSSTSNSRSSISSSLSWALICLSSWLVGGFAGGFG